MPRGLHQDIGVIAGAPRAKRQFLSHAQKERAEASANGRDNDVKGAARRFRNAMNAAQRLNNQLGFPR